MKSNFNEHVKERRSEKLAQHQRERKTENTTLEIQ